ncbi:uncharacterized protein FTOL_07865 [Fusarium torulosum]|uniref:Uncharacterized protein n=1 Tax=Fusarium torulosum TaxID=33205 RepID=A0AAE8MBQ7_9HYPO|nr:uncharacterized protein FTOL_07865 [Fusarium torulosum]
MRRSLLLALWSAGALGGPCKPARDLTHNHYDLPSAAPSTYLTPTQPSQDTAVETHTAGGSDGGDEEGSVSIHSTGSFTQGSGSHTVGISGNSVTADPVFASDTTTADGELPEASHASDAAGVPGAPSVATWLARTRTTGTTGPTTSSRLSSVWTILAD